MPTIVSDAIGFYDLEQVTHITKSGTLTADGSDNTAILNFVSGLQTQTQLAYTTTTTTFNGLSRTAAIA